MTDQNTGSQPPQVLPDGPMPWPQGPTKFELRFGNNTTRIVVAVIAVPLILGVVFVGGWWFTLLVAAMATGALLEFYWMLERRGIQPNKKLSVVAGLLLVLSFSYSDVHTLLGQIALWLKGTEGGGYETALLQSPLGSFPLTIAVSIFLVFTSLIIELRRDNRQALLNVMGTLTGFFYIALGMATFLGLHHFVADTARFNPSPEVDGAVIGFLSSGDMVPSYMGGIVVMVLLIGIWTCDSFAYFGGRAFGKHKLFERVSPKKTWEGAICGAAASIAASVGLGAWLWGLTWYDGLFIGIAAGVFGQLGDLVESHVKRGCGVKDSSQIIPGHGGILDRFDSLLFVAPLVYLYVLVCR